MSPDESLDVRVLRMCALCSPSSPVSTKHGTLRGAPRRQAPPRPRHTRQSTHPRTVHGPLRPSRVCPAVWAVCASDAPARVIALSPSPPCVIELDSRDHWHAHHGRDELSDWLLAMQSGRWQPVGQPERPRCVERNGSLGEGTVCTRSHRDEHSATPRPVAHPRKRDDPRGEAKCATQGDKPDACAG